MRRFVVAVLVGVVLSGCATAGPSPVGGPNPLIRHSTVADEHFYHSLPYGSESQFNPITEIMNEGFDMFRIDNMDRKIGDFPYAKASTNVLRQLVHADSAFRAYGLSWTLRDELFPLSMGRSGGPQWLANYTCHFLGSGMVSARMVEWYEAHGVPHPVALSAVSMFAAHFTNEMVEDGGSATRSHPLDAVVDLYVFDVAGFLTFRSERVQQLFSSDRLQFTNWQGQATVTLPDHRLENTDQEFILRFGMPRTDRWRGLVGFGIYSMGGLSYGPRNGTSVSLAAGGDIKTPVVDSLTGRRGVALAPYGGLFVDRRGSLLGSIVVKDSREVLVSANLYPGVIRVGGTTFGLWGQVLRDHRWRVGIVPSWGVGVGRSDAFSRSR